MKTVICDLETDGLFDYKEGTAPTKVWCIVTKDLTTGEIAEFYGDTLNDFVDYSAGVDKWIGHNFLLFDRKVLATLMGIDIPVTAIEDTLIMSRLVEPKIQGGHSLDAWGERIGRYKPTHEDWSQFSEAMLHRCKEDVEINTILYHKLTQKLKGFSGYCQRLEHYVSDILERRQERGAYVNKPRIEELLHEVESKRDAITNKLQEYFPPERVLYRVLTPRYNKTTGELHGQDGNSLRKFDHEINTDGTYNLYIWKEFNIGSNPQVVEKMNQAGWKPTERTKSGQSWKVSDTNLDTLPDDAPEAYHKIVEWRMLSNRATVLQGWLDAIGKDGNIHGRILSLGTWTHRMSHSSPQMGNIPALRNEYGPELRECWTVRDLENYRLVGTDLSSIQVRILAHYMNDQEYIDQVVSGDVHSYSLEASEGMIPDRDHAKATLYAMLLGASDWKLGAMNGGDVVLGGEIRNALFRNIPGFATVDRLCDAYAERGWFYGIDGRRITLKGRHWALAAMLQEGEATVQKRSLVVVDRDAVRCGLDAALINVVHDETQTVCHKDHTEELIGIQQTAVRETGEFFKLRCPLDAESKVGLTWKETH